MWVHQIFRWRYRTIRCMNGLKKFLVILIMLFSVGYCSYYCYGQSLQTLDFTPPKSVFDDLNESLTQLELSLNLLKIENERLQKLQNEQATYLHKLELQSKTYEKKSVFWRNTSIALICISVPTVTTLLIVVKNKGS